MKWYFVLAIVVASIVAGVLLDKYVLSTPSDTSDTPEGPEH